MTVANNPANRPAAAGFLRTGMRWGRIPWNKIIAFILVIPLAIMFLVPFY